MTDLQMVVGVLSTTRFTHTNEAGLQVEIAAALIDAGLMGVLREVRLTTPADRIDLLVGQVGIEVKVAGTVGDVSRQLRRYALSWMVDHLVLVSTKVRHRELHGTGYGRRGNASPVDVTVVTPRWL